jgi:dTDP-4-dehydrorhamnose reductase
MHAGNGIEIWGGIECTINRVGDRYLDQLEYSGHYLRENDPNLIHSLGIKTLRYPVLWERHQPTKGTPINWEITTKNLKRLRELDIQPIAGLVHHGSGPAFVSFLDGSFEQGLAAYARQVAKEFPWINLYTPVNEPLTTARFCGLYGHWYPHGKNDYTFFKILLSECRATVMAMKAIREINPAAQLVQTEDLGKCYSTQLLSYQAAMENERRWLSYDLLCGKLTPDKLMWRLMTAAGIERHELEFFLEHPCIPDIAGFNYYITSERYLDEDLAKYPVHYHGGNGIHAYADIETVRADMHEETGAALLLKEAWERLRLPLAITECHLHSRREDQLRWFNEMWLTLCELKADGLDIRAITAWAIFGLHGWNELVTKPGGVYEHGIFDTSSGKPRPTALARYLQQLTSRQICHHPVLRQPGFWKRARLSQCATAPCNTDQPGVAPPLLIMGPDNALARAFRTICTERCLDVHFLQANKHMPDNPVSLKEILTDINPWAVIYTGHLAAGDDTGQHNSLLVLAALCAEREIKLLTCSSALVFDATAQVAYAEHNLPNASTATGTSLVQAEQALLQVHPNTLIIRTGLLFSPWEKEHFIANLLLALKAGLPIPITPDNFSATYVPDLVHTCLDLLLDPETGIVHAVNEGMYSQETFVRALAARAGCEPWIIDASLQESDSPERTLCYPKLRSEKGIRLPSLNQALEHYFECVGKQYADETTLILLED